METEAGPQPQKPQPKPQPPPDEVKLSPAEWIELRNQFAGVALAEIVKWQVAEHKAGQEDVAASWAFRYANAMLAEAKKPMRNLAVYRAKGVPGVTEEPMVEVQ